MLAHLEGQRLQSVVHDKECSQWVFLFSNEMSLSVFAPWRIVDGAGIQLGCDDHGQQFGLPVPLDAFGRLSELAIERAVEQATTAPWGDLTVEFAGGSSLNIFNGSCGYEGWVLSGPGERWVVGQGGGRVVESEHDAEQALAADAAPRRR